MFSAQVDFVLDVLKNNNFTYGNLWFVFPRNRITCLQFNRALIQLNFESLLFLFNPCKTHLKLCLTEPDFLKKVFYSKNWENGPKIVFYDFIEKFGHEHLLTLFCNEN